MRIVVGFALITMLTITTNAQAGITFAKTTTTPKDAAMTVTQYGFRSLKDAEEFGQRYAGNTSVISTLETRLDQMASEIDVYILIHPKKRREWEEKEIHRLGTQVGLFTVAIKELKKRNGAGVMIGSWPVK